MFCLDLEDEVSLKMEDLTQVGISYERTPDRICKSVCVLTVELFLSDICMYYKCILPVI